MFLGSRIGYDISRWSLKNSDKGNWSLKLKGDIMKSVGDLDVYQASTNFLQGKVSLQSFLKPEMKSWDLDYWSLW